MWIVEWFIFNLYFFFFFFLYGTLISKNKVLFIKFLNYYLITYSNLFLLINYWYERLTIRPNKCNSLKTNDYLLKIDKKPKPSHYDLWPKSKLSPTCSSKLTRLTHSHSCVHQILNLYICHLSSKKVKVLCS